MRRFRNVLAGLMLAAAASGAEAQQLVANSNGFDWLAADLDQRQAWSQQIARLFNKQEAYGEALNACLNDTLADRDDADLAVLDEMRQGDLPMITAGCVLSIDPAEAPSH